LPFLPAPNRTNITWSLQTPASDDPTARWRNASSSASLRVTSIMNRSQVGQVASGSWTTLLRVEIRSVSMCGQSTPVRRSSVPLATFRSHGSASQSSDDVASSGEPSASATIAAILAFDLHDLPAATAAGGQEPSGAVAAQVRSAAIERAVCRASCSTSLAGASCQKPPRWRPLVSTGGFHRIHTPASER